MSEWVSQVRFVAFLVALILLIVWEHIVLKKLFLTNQKPLRVPSNRLSDFKKEKTKVVVFIPTTIQSVRRRHFVNRQFAKEAWRREDVVVFWVLGSKTGKRLELDLQANLSQVMTEPFMSQSNTLITSCRDSGDEENNANGTSSTTCKFFEAMRFVHQRFDCQYVWRGADDAYLNLQLFLKLMPSLPKHAMWLGQPRKDQNRISDIYLDTQPQIQKLFGLKSFPNNYMLGMGSAFTADIAMLLANWNIPPNLTWCEDVVVGLWMTIFRLNRVDLSPLFVNRPGSAANRWPYDYTYGNLTVLILHYIRDHDWDHIAADGTILIPCTEGSKACSDPFDFVSIGKQITTSAAEYPAIAEEWRKIHGIAEPAPPPPSPVVTVNRTIGVT